MINPIAAAHELDELVRILDAVEELCMDTEADSLHHYQEKVCLIQLTLPSTNETEALHFLIDPLVELDLNPLFEILRGKKLVLHGADYDLRILRRDFGFRPKEIFDTMFAARLAGHSALGLDALVNRYIGIALDHGTQKTDWSKRPLSERQLKYAVEDTAHLPKIASHLRDELRQLGRAEWHHQQCHQLIEQTGIDRERDPDQNWRIKGSSVLDPKSQALLRELWHWRDVEAKDWDRPPFMVCTNARLLELVAWGRENEGKDILTSKKIPYQWSASRKKSLRKALQRAWNLPPSEWPRPPERGVRPRMDPLFPPRVARMREIRNQIAVQLNLEPSILAPQAQLEAIAARCPNSLADFDQIEKWLPWQTELLGSSFLQALTTDGGPAKDP
jgi:ribonuclease D